MSRFEGLKQKAAEKLSAETAEKERLAKERMQAALHGTFVDKFERRFTQVVLGDGWRPEAIGIVEPYFDALISRVDVPLPEIGTRLATEMNTLFVETIIEMNDGRLRDMMVGNRAEWFGQLYGRVKNAPKKAKTGPARKAQTKPIHTSSGGSSDDNQSPDSNQETGTVAEALGEEQISKLVKLFRGPGVVITSEASEENSAAS